MAKLHGSPEPRPAEASYHWVWARLVAKIVLAVLTAPYRRTFKLYTWKPLRDFRDADGDPKRLIPMIRDWKLDKYAELQSVQVAASFCAGATFATISWTKIENPIWVADALWFCSLICSIWAVITSIQTKSILDDIPDKDQLNQSLPESEQKRMKRVILRYKKTPGVGHWVMLFIWQFPSMTMSYAWCTFLSGLTIYVCTPFIRNDDWSEHHRVAIVYLAVGSLGFCTYVFSTVFVYASEKAYLQSTTVTRANSFISDPESSGGISEKDMQAGMNTKQHDLGSKPEDQVRAVPARGRRDRDAQTDMTQESVRSVRSRRQLLI